MKQWLKLWIILPLAVIVLSCEEEVPDYAADVIGTYIVESMVYDGDTIDFTDRALEEAIFVKITRDDLQLFTNNDDPCDDGYEVETDEIEGVTETAILYSDGSQDDYSFEDGKLIFDDSGDLIVLIGYSDIVPPPVWTDPTLLTNDTYEPNNTFATATVITAGGAIQDHYLGMCSDEDYFIFNATAGTNYFMGTSTLTAYDLDLTIRLYTAAGEELAYNDDYNTLMSYNPGLDWSCPTTGNYYFVIAGLGSSETGAYTVSVVETTSLLKVPAPPIEKHKEVKVNFRDVLFNR